MPVSPRDAICDARRPRAGRSGARAVRRGRAPAPLLAPLLAPALLLALGAVLSGCTTTSTDTGTAPFTTGHELRFTEINAERFKPWTNVMPVYRLGPGDKVKIKYFITREMDEELTVSPDGTMAPRAVGQMRVEGMTLAGAQEAVSRASRKELAQQKVVISLEEAAAARVYVGGMVANQGAFKLPDTGTGVLQGILLAGGFTEEARAGQVALIRRGPNNEPMLRLINVRDLIQTGFPDDVPLMSGDIIYVPRSSIAEVNLWIDQFINKVVPFQRTFSYTLGSYSTNTGSIIP
ncbi:polysaccharide biosynthesis/export family protein [Xanthobacter tagetidis]|uniref:Polysaccharide export protein n=1 Tax=Xanthobacter tagetidis TaxID=60216 RepID=A0A3L7AMW3_9HYPH|nr:polysaccharide biosynthesis/export family protein [Xanthobacter tagetidis]MBB6308168.1 protein involved in polysaccharide export with SLBB domain [Xanthobacter tagetidis]RLP81789.1 polysaccharide export protein [Xanthobacter tagetidis]